MRLCPSRLRIVARLTPPLTNSVACVWRSWCRTPTMAFCYSYTASARCAVSCSRTTVLVAASVSTSIVRSSLCTLPGLNQRRCLVEQRGRAGARWSLCKRPRPITSGAATKVPSVASPHTLAIMAALAWHNAVKVLCLRDRMTDRSAVLERVVSEAV